MAGPPTEPRTNSRLSHSRTIIFSLKVAAFLPSSCRSPSVKPCSSPKQTFAGDSGFPLSLCAQPLGNRVHACVRSAIHLKMWFFYLTQHSSRFIWEGRSGHLADCTASNDKSLFCFNYLELVFFACKEEAWPTGAPFSSDACAFPLHFQALKACPGSFGMGQGRADLGGLTRAAVGLGGTPVPCGRGRASGPTSWYLVLFEHRSERKNVLLWFGSVPS